MDEIQYRLLLSEIREMRNSGKGFVEIRNTYEAKKTDPEMLRNAIRRIDNEDIERFARKSSMDKQFDKMMMGIVGIVIGIGLSTLLFRQAHNIPLYYIVMFGPIVAGYFVFSGAWRKYKQAKAKDRS
ncbi:MAG: hypothetical protein RIS47_2284 [Bacteroidota bacterium]|jgi:Na+/glutamate symporter